jgi:hypothetical protein
MQEGQTGLARADYYWGMTGCSCPSEREVGSRFGLVWSVWSGLVSSGLVFVWEAGAGGTSAAPIAAWLREPTHPSSEACER